MKYHVTVKCAGVDIRIKNVEASNREDAEIIAHKRAKESIKVVGSTIAVEEKSSAKPTTGEETYKQFFGKG